MVKISGGASCHGRNVAAGEGESPASAEITKHVHSANDNTERTERTQRAARGEPAQSE